MPLQRGSQAYWTARSALWLRHGILRGSRMVKIAAAQFSFLTEHDRPQM